MLLSIITLTYNNKQELLDTLASVPVSDFIEIIIVNGGKEVYSSEILKGNNGQIINEKDNGIADAFNKGVNASSGDAVMFLNSGDILINKDYPVEALNILKSGEPSFVHSNIIFIDEAGGELLVRPPVHNNIGRGMKYLHPSVIMKKDIFNRVGMFNTSYRIAMDYDLMARIEKSNLKGYYINGSPVVRMPGGGKSQSHEFEAIKECIRSLKENKILGIKNFYGFFVRLLFYFLRRILSALGGKKALGRLKKIRYSSPL